MKTASVDSYYHLKSGVPQEAVCNGLACFVARKQNPDRWMQGRSQNSRLHCLGKCYEAPATAGENSLPFIESITREPVVLKRIVKGSGRSLGKYVSSGGYQALELARSESVGDLIGCVEASGLRGRGGAGYPAGKKWRAVQNAPAEEKFVVANADEGDPGAFIDRIIMEQDPHCLIEGLAIAAHAVGAGKGYIYVRNEYPEAARVLRDAVADVASSGFLHGLKLEVFSGKGSYVCGEETALLNSIEGKRGEPRIRPPYPTQEGLFGKPTLVQNVETLANIPWIIEHSAEAYRLLGFSHSRGTKVISLNSLFRKPGLYEVEFGISIRAIVEDVGGGLRSGSLKGVLIGGPLAGIIPPELMDTPFGFEELQSIGASVGHGGVIAFDENTSIVELLHHTFAFGTFESCGKCVPCRAGSNRIHEILDEILTNGAAPAARYEEFTAILSAMHALSFCGFGTGLADFGRSVLRHYSKELQTCFL